MLPPDEWPDDLDAAAELADALLLLGTHHSDARAHHPRCHRCGERWPCDAYVVQAAGAQAIHALTRRSATRKGG